MKKHGTTPVTQFGMTVKDLRRAIRGLPDDTPVLYQRIEDQYFLKSTVDGNGPNHPWGTITLPFDADSRSEYIRAWGAYVRKYRGKTIVIVDAHY
jgi:hypothetical protein